MATAAQFREIALALPGTTEVPHFERRAFRVAKIFASLAADEASANVRLDPEEQEIRCMIHTQALSPVPNKWGQQGWTIVHLGNIDRDLLSDILRSSWLWACPADKPARRR